MAAVGTFLNSRTIMNGTQQKIVTGTLYYFRTRGVTGDFGSGSMETQRIPVHVLRVTGSSCGPDVTRSGRTIRHFISLEVGGGVERWLNNVESEFVVVFYTTDQSKTWKNICKNSPVKSCTGYVIKKFFTFVTVTLFSQWFSFPPPGFLFSGSAGVKNRHRGPCLL